MRPVPQISSVNHEFSPGAPGHPRAELLAPRVSPPHLSPRDAVTQALPAGPATMSIGALPTTGSAISVTVWPNPTLGKIPSALARTIPPRAPRAFKRRRPVLRPPRFTVLSDVSP